MNGFILYIILVSLMSCSEQGNQKSKLQNAKYVNSTIQSNVIDKEGILSFYKKKNIEVFDNSEWVSIKANEQELLKKLSAREKLAVNNADVSIEKILLNNKSIMDKYFDIEFQIWEFVSTEKAKEYFEVMKSSFNSSSYFEKPPKKFFLKDNYLFFFSVPVFNKRQSLEDAKNYLMDEYFQGKSTVDCD